ncbi:hypothetical protein SAMN05421788_11459 [Filimonas lacunae]|uniref:Uncharacterized protein n=1 Tax=Filimonas lacunae TaxID=477680 RepID=A0A173MLW6_9BACT|nr:hypothetical protein [Filimonas lacunae]BAV08477.1 hypothetical protein FLA_4518 [Filimonas lacunae]SIT33996.1 hypothetical protein SAMN05421788_11459 [Filimonas lacunae]
MKKVLFVLALGAFAACGSGENKENTADSTPKVDSPVVVAPVTPDTTVKAADTTAPVVADTTKK